MTALKQQYTAEFKQEAVRLVQRTGKSCVQIARDLGVPAHSVVRWKKQQEVQSAEGRPVFTGRGIAGRSEQEDRIKHLERELDIARQERDILDRVSPLPCQLLRIVGAAGCSGRWSTRT